MPKTNTKNTKTTSPRRAGSTPAAVAYYRPKPTQSAKPAKDQASHRAPVYRRPIFILGLIAIVILGLCAYFIVKPAPTIDDDPWEDGTTVTPPRVEETDDDPKHIIQFEGEDPNTQDTLSGNFTLVSPAGGNLAVAASIDQYLAQGGECRLELTRLDAVYYTTSQPVTADVTTSVCGPFRIPLTNIPAGTYNLNLTVLSDGKTGRITTTVNL